MTEAKLKTIKSKAKAPKKPSPMEELLICKQNIARLAGEQDAWQTRYQGLLDSIIEKGPAWEKTKMQEKKGSKSDSFKEGKTIIIRTPSVRRILRMEEIRAKFPDFMKAHGTVGLTIADKILGSETVNKFCDTETSYRYEVQGLER